MKKSLKRIIFIIFLFMPGCVFNVPPPTVEDNIFISYGVPKIMIKVSDRLVYQTGTKNNNQGTDSFGSLATKGVLTEKYIFTNNRSKTGLVIMIERFAGVAGKWYMNAPDYSLLPGIKAAGTTKMNGALYSTGIQMDSRKDGRFIYKFYGRTAGAGDDVRFQIIYIEMLDITSPTSEFIEQFSSRADNSFTILPYTATIPAKTSKNEEDNVYLKQNADKTDGTPCRDSLECAKGYFCINKKCTKGFAD